MWIDVELWLLLTNCWQMVLVLILPERPTLSYELPPSNFSRSPNSNLSKNLIFTFLSYRFFTPISKNPIMITMLLDFLHLPTYRSLVKICEKLFIFTFIKFNNNNNVFVFVTSFNMLFPDSNMSNFYPFKSW